MWKHAIVSALFKQGSRLQPLQYRPVSVTSVCCKVMERAIYSHSVEYLESNHLLSQFQYGFRAGRSTEDQLLFFYGRVAKWVDAGQVVDVVFLDFAKAFDVVSHGLLVDKLTSLGFDRHIIGWIRSFVMDRTMVVSVEGALSTTRSITSGVPQGSVLGPLLFLIYANYIADSVGCCWVAFADDFMLGLSVSDESEADLQRDLESIVSRARSWNMNVNPEKCVSMRFGSRTSGRAAAYRIGGIELETVLSYKDLGIRVDSSLRFHSHIDAVVCKAGGLMCELLRSTVCRSVEFMLTLFASHIRPIIDYCSPVWFTGFLGDVRRLESIQRRWTREIAGMSLLDYPNRLRTLELYSVYGRLLRADLVKIWKILNLDSLESLTELFTLSGETRTRGHRFKLVVPACRTEVLRRSFSVRRIATWNSLPPHVVESTSLSSFKRALDDALSGAFYELV